jgi:hypothetical protein
MFQNKFSAEFEMRQFLTMADGSDEGVGAAHVESPFDQMLHK